MRGTQIVDLAIGAAVLAVSVYDLAKGKTSLSFADYDKTSRPLPFYSWVTFGIVCGAVLIIASFR